MVFLWAGQGHVHTGHQAMPVKKAIIDVGITPYPYPKWLCRIIAVGLFANQNSFKSLKLMKAVMPPERWTPKGEDPEEHYRKLLNSGKIIIPARRFIMSSGLLIIIPCLTLCPRQTQRLNTGMEKRKKQQEKTTLHMQRGRFHRLSQKNLKDCSTPNLL